MIGTLITMTLFIGVFSVALGTVLGYLLWTPPGQ